MSREQKNNADWFPHYIPKSGTRMYIFEEQFGLQGYAAYFKLLELLTVAENHVLDFNKAKDLKSYKSRIKASDEVFNNIMTLFVELDIIDKELYEVNKIVFCQDLADSLYELYRKRGRSVPSKPNPNNCDNKAQNDDNNRLEEKRRVKKSKGEEILTTLVFSHDDDDFKSAWSLWLKYRKETHRFTYKTIESMQAAMKKLNTLSAGNKEHAIHLINHAIERQWMGFYQDKDYGKQQQTHNNGKQQSFNSTTVEDAYFAAKSVKD